MDSGNSGGSMQSSDEEYESRGDSFASFLNPSSGNGSGGGGGRGRGSHFGSLAQHQHQQAAPGLPHQYHQSNMFNSNSQNLEAAFATNNNNNNNNSQYGNDDVLWSRGLRSQNNHHPNFENFVALSSSSSSTPSSNQSLFGASQLLKNKQPSSSTMPLQLQSQSQSQSLEGNPPRGLAAGSNQLNNDHHQQSTVLKNPKKRTRASRRAPTTVLTTDTTNFRQMVQEFTGIPAAPFSSTSPYSRRLDLFSGVGGGGGGGGMMGIRSGNLDALNPLYPLRPSAQKLQISPFLAQSSSNLITSTMLEALVSATTNPNTNTNNASSNTTNDTTPENLLSIHNQILSFQVQQNQQQPTPLGTKSVTATTANANVTSSSLLLANNNNNLRSTTQQQQGVPVVTSFHDLGLNHENANKNIVGNINQQLSGSNYQFNCSAPTSEFHSDKGLENVQSSSGEGTIGQWVCSDH